MKSKRLFYMGLEPYEERYTCQMETWFRNQFKTWCDGCLQDVSLHVMQGRGASSQVQTGVVLDAHGRCVWALTQMADLVDAIRFHGITKDDVIFFEDFWHPGMEALPYIFDQTGVRPRVYARCHAQSVDCHDFTFPMRRWMRHYERGECVWLEKVFVASDKHIDMLVGAGMGPRDKFVNVGLPFDINEVLQRVPNDLRPKEKTVLFASRWDDEKQPWFFLQVAEAVRVKRKRDDIWFKATTSRAEHSAGGQRMLRDCEGNEHVDVCFCTKDEYYQELRSAKVQFNCALQDFVSYGLIESSLYNCHPVYPYFLSFPECFAYEHYPWVFYTPFDVDEAARRVIVAIDRDVSNYDFSFIASRHHGTYGRILDEMFG